MPILEIDSDDATDLASFYTWLTEDSDIRRSVELKPIESTPQEGAMGPILDLIQFVVSSSFSATSLAFAFANWKLARDSKATLTIRDGDREVTIPGAEAADLETIKKFFDEREGS